MSLSMVTLDTLSMIALLVACLCAATVQFSVAVRNAELNAIETTIGVSAVLQIRSGAKPANCAAASTGTVLATLNLPADWMADAASGAKSLLGTWQDLSADASGTAGHFRIFDNGVSACGIQGSVTATGGGGDLTLDNIALVAGQIVNVTGFTLTGGNG